MVIYFLLDDADYLNRKYDQIGNSLYDENEASIVYDLCVMLDGLIDRLGPRAPDADYINCPDWLDVVNQAKLALIVLARRHH